MASFLLPALVSLLLLSSAVANDLGEDDIIEEGEEDLDDESEIDGMSLNGAKISFGIPEEDDDFHDIHIPDDFKCDACKLMAKKFTMAFDKANKKRPSLKKNLPLSEVMDILDEECYDDYAKVGVKEIAGIPRLTGPGMSHFESPGIMQGGGKWPLRLTALCLDMIGEVGDETIYELYKGDKLGDHYCLVEWKKSKCVTKGKDGMVRVEL